MKRVLLLITLTMFTFMAGYAQFDITTQPGYDAQMEEIFGQAPVSEDLPAVLDLSSMMKGNRDLTGMKGYGSLIPSSGSYSGKLYEIDFGTGSTKTIKNYPSFYFTAMEHVDYEGVTPTTYVFCNDFTKGFGTVNLETGVYTKIAKIKKGMTDLTFNHATKTMYGLRYGKIWEINITDGTATTQVTTANNYIAIACSTSGDMYAVTQDASNNAQLVKFAGCNFNNPVVINSDLGYTTQYTQSMTYDHNTDKLVWWQVNKSGKHIVEINPTTGAVDGTPTQVSTAIGGLFVKFSNKPHDITANFTAAEGNVTLSTTSAMKGTTITVTVVPEGCNEIAAVATTPELTVTCTTPGVYTFVMPAEDVKVNVTFTTHPTISKVELAAEEQFLCYGETTTLTATATIVGEPTPVITYDWYLGENKKGSTTTNTYEATEQGTWKVVATTEHGCTATSETVGININDPVEAPELTTETDTICSGEEVTINIRGFEVGADKMVRYVNETAIDTVAYAEDWKVTPTQTSTYKVKGYQSYMGEIFCESPMSNEVTITVSPLNVVITEGSAATECATGAEYTLHATANEGVTFTWTCEGLIQSTTGATLTFNLPTELTEQTVYNIKVTGTKGEVCKEEATFVLTVNPLPTVALVEKVEQIGVCPGGTFTIHVENPDATLYNYQWYKDDEALPGQTGTQYQKTGASEETDPGFYSVVATLKSTGCGSAPAQIGVAVLEPADAPSIEMAEGENNPICYGYKTTLVLGGEYEKDDFFFEWYQKEGTEWVKKDTMYGVAHDVVSFDTDELTTDTEFKLRVRHGWAQEDGNCWAESDVFTVQVKPNTPVDVYASVGGDTLVYVEDHYNACHGLVFDLVAAEGFETYQWYKKVGTEYVKIEEETADERIYNNETDIEIDGDYEYRVVVTDNGECEFHGDLKVRVNALPEVTLKGETPAEEGGYYKEVCSGYKTTIYAEGADNYTWGVEPEEGITFASNADSCWFTAAEGEYLIWLTGTNSTTACAKSTTIDVVINPLPVLAITSPVDGKTYNMYEHFIELSATIGGVEATEGQGKFYLDGAEEEYDDTMLDLMLLADGNHYVTFEYTDEKGCENSVVSNFTVERTYWSDADVRQGDWYDIEPEQRYEIGTAEQYGYFLYLIETGEDNFEGKVIHIVDNIDFAGRFVKPHSGFKGVLEGYGKQLSNYTVVGDVAGDIVNKGVIRNIGFKDVMVYMTTTNSQINLANEGSILNSYMTGSTFRFMGPQQFNIINKEGAKIMNVYFYNSQVLDEAALTITNNGTVKYAYSKPAIAFGGFTIPEFTDAATLMTSLNAWTDSINTADFYDWTADTLDVNYKHPIHEWYCHMVHYDVDLMHVVGGTGSIARSNIQEYEDGTYDIIVKRGKDKSVTFEEGPIDQTIYGFAYDTVTVTVNPDLYCRLDSLNVIAGNGVEVESYEEDGYIYFCMPVDSIKIHTNINVDYWTDLDYADFSWYTSSAYDSYEIGTAAQLAGLARIVNGINYEKYDFAGKTVSITNNIDLSGHMWKGIDGFKGTFEGYTKVIENMRSIDAKAGLFASLGSGAEVRNLGVTDSYVETTAEAQTKVAGAVDGAAIIAVNNAGSILNCYVNDVEVKGAVNTAVAVASNVSGAQVKNVYAAQVDKADATQFIATNAGTCISNFAEFTTTEDGVTPFTSDDKNALPGYLNNWVVTTGSQTYYPWENRAGENDGYAVFTEEQHYFVAVAPTEHGIVVPTPNHSVAGTTITLTVTTNVGENIGYELNTLTITYDEGEGEQIVDVKETKSFKMPAANVTVNATFTMINWNITYAEAENGTISGDATGNYNQTKTVTVEPATGYELVSLKAGEEDITETKQFTMPNSNVTVTAEFDGVYRNITVAKPENGTLTATPSDKQRYTHEVAVEYTSENGYVIDKILVTNTDDSSTPAIDITLTKKFDMPLYNVTITATFKEGFWTDLGIRDTKWYTENPNATVYHFTTANQLGGLSYLVNGFDNDSLVANGFEGVKFYIDNNIDMHVYKWRPIGGQVKTTRTFKGTFEGNGYEITAMTIDDIKGSYQAFFGVNDGVINNLNISGTSHGKYWVAGVAGKNNGTIINCVSNVAVTSTFEAAGIAAYNYGTIENCYNRGNIINTSADFKAALNVGGITATNAKTGKIYNCYNVGTLDGTGSSPVSYFGGIVGRNITGAVVMNSYWLNTMTKGVGYGKIDASCHSFTPEYGQAEGDNSLVAELCAYTVEKEYLLKWKNGTGDYLYPVFAQQDTKDEEFNEIADVTEGDINLYPNPAREYVRIECEGIQRVKVVNMVGQIVIDQNYDTNNVQLDTHNLIPGMYTVSIVTEDGTFSRNLVITR